ncbi:hypothetical protein CB0940_11422 [Cercospora beticola]|uniref:Uncharacterized protein n=1 Tax=Cercospora beticola TaxID=122368 RepID=A0A2G5HD20_CERBT|nr:hypothetical protein CB0940_11422 [Cercospora beticola]PIA90454.1 hypothetical protein CB0940_11422 [Cercospora beticola]WPB08274.1 hypothetical protein RHO25_012940 [Cercospora beticola]CAK1367846.1 unnamed protein product [Cercospora beticola]
MYRTTDPRFRRRINDITHTLESANEATQSGIYIFGQNYIKPCFDSIGSCFTTCIDASCPSLNLSQRDRIRRQRARGNTRGRAELSFDFYDDWDEDENDGLLGWGNDEFDRLVAGSGAHGGYGATDAQPARQREMSYPKGRRKSIVEGEDPTVIPGSSGGFFRRLFGGGKDLRYRPSAADLQEHPGAKKNKVRLDHERTEGEALLEDDELGVGRRGKARARSGTQGSHNTSSSYSSRGDIFPSDEEDDAIPLDDEFAMVLERRGTMTGMETESSSGRIAPPPKRGKRPSAGSRTSTRTVSSRSARSERGNSRKRRSRTSSYARTPSSDEIVAEEAVEDSVQERTPSYADLKRQEAQIAEEEEAEITRRRESALRLAEERGLAPEENLSSKEATPRSTTPAVPEVPTVPEETGEEVGDESTQAERNSHT